MVDRASYVPPFKLGEPLQGGAVGDPSPDGYVRCMRQFDHVIDYKATGNLSEALLQAAPQRDRCVLRQCRGRAPRGRAHSGQPVFPLALCGMISQYNVARMPAGPRNLIFAVGKSIRLEGLPISGSKRGCPARRSPVQSP